MTIDEWNNTITETLPSATWGIPLLSLGFILFIVFLITLIIGLNKKK